MVWKRPCDAYWIGSGRRLLDVILSQTDEVGLLNGGRKWKGVPLVEGLSFVSFVHDIFDKVASDLANVGTLVGCPELGGKDRNCFCFIHMAMMAQNRSKIKGSCAAYPIGFRTLPCSMLYVLRRLVIGTSASSTCSIVARLMLMPFALFPKSLVASWREVPCGKDTKDTHGSTLLRREKRETFRIMV